MSLNRVILVGRVATEIELKYTPQGSPVANFNIAVDRFVKKGEERGADFFSVVVWGSQAEFAAQYLSKGRQIAIDGRLQAREWAAQDGSKRKVVEIVGDRVEALDKPKEEQQVLACEIAGDEEGETEDPFDF